MSYNNKKVQHTSILHLSTIGTGWKLNCALQKMRKFSFQISVWNKPITTSNKGQGNKYLYNSDKLSNVEFWVETG